MNIAVTEHFRCPIDTLFSSPWAGKRVLVLEKEVFPRFHIGESLLPCNMTIFRDMGVLPALRMVTVVSTRSPARAATSSGSALTWTARDASPSRCPSRSAPHPMPWQYRAVVSLPVPQSMQCSIRSAP